MRKSPLSNSHHRVRYVDGCKGFARSKSALSNSRHRVRYVDGCKGGAIIKSPLSNSRHRIIPPVLNGIGYDNIRGFITTVISRDSSDLGVCVNAIHKIPDSNVRNGLCTCRHSYQQQHRAGQ